MLEGEGAEQENRSGESMCSTRPWAHGRHAELFSSLKGSLGFSVMADRANRLSLLKLKQEDGSGGAAL